MLIKITEDVFDISNRLKEIDSNYFVVFNTKKQKFEIHNKSQKNTYCLTVLNNKLDCRAIEQTLKSRRERFDKILQEIEKNNQKIIDDNNKKIKDMAEWKLKEMFDYSSRHNTDNFDDAYKTSWA
ncbi:MAG: hypothetical protein IJ837_02125 [Clostridia bacterium]|nr:hypothetical protein [Clostridia bacterium]